jgi:hypothetical protein
MTCCQDGTDLSLMQGLTLGHFAVPKTDGHGHQNQRDDTSGKPAA